MHVCRDRGFRSAVRFPDGGFSIFRLTSGTSVSVSFSGEIRACSGFDWAERGGRKHTVAPCYAKNGKLNLSADNQSLAFAA